MAATTNIAFSTVLTSEKWNFTSGNTMTVPEDGTYRISVNGTVLATIGAGTGKAATLNLDLHSELLLNNVVLTQAPYKLSGYAVPTAGTKTIAFQLNHNTVNTLAAGDVLKIQIIVTESTITGLTLELEYLAGSTFCIDRIA